MQFIDLLDKVSDGSTVRLNKHFEARVGDLRGRLKPAMAHSGVIEIRAISSDFFDVFVDDIKKGNSDNG